MTKQVYRNDNTQERKLKKRREREKERMMAYVERLGGTRLNTHTSDMMHIDTTVHTYTYIKMHHY